MNEKTPSVAVIGGGPAGLMAAEALLVRGVAVDIFDAMPSLGRKFLMAGKSGLNLTHVEPQEAFAARFGEARTALESALTAFDAETARNSAGELGIETFVGSSGRVFPSDYKAAPLLRAWLRRLRAAGARIHVRHKWHGWNIDGAMRFNTPNGPRLYRSDATILALGGGSWPRLGSDASWVAPLRNAGIEIAPLRPANCGFEVSWSEHFRERFAGAPVKAVTLAFGDTRFAGEFVITGYGIEGGAIYTLSAALRDAIEAGAPAVLSLDLCPDRTESRLAADLAKPRGKRSMSNHLRRTTGLTGVKASLLRECLDAGIFADPARLAAAIKALPLRLTAPRPLAEAISTAGGISFEALETGFMLTSYPGIFCVGEMLDWEAPTGGYLIGACLATGRAAGNAAADWLAAQA